MTHLTKINKIEMRGFKAFANKTEILFGDAFNAIIGPNGSGKSNVFDALCFVLGKGSAKEMRVEKSSNLIYNGGKLKNPAKEGEVTIYFDNSKHIFPKEQEVKKKRKTNIVEENLDNELKLTRIIKEEGQSVYKINNKTRTRQQVLDMMEIAKINPDGYNIILQGDIVKFVEMPTIERRGIIEEISGIKVYEDKKEKTLRELQKVEEKLNEAEIILTERKTYLNELKKDRDQALKFKELNDKIKRNKATVLDLKMRLKEVEKNRLDKDINDSKVKIEAIQEEIVKLRNNVKEKKDEIDRINREVEERGEKEQVQIHKEVEKLKIDLALSNEKVNHIETEIQKITDRKLQLNKSLSDIEARIENLTKNKTELNERIKSKEADIKNIEHKIKTFKEKNKLDDIQDIDKQIEQIDKEAEKDQEDVQKLREEQQNLLREKDKLELQIQGIDEKIDKVLSIEKENKKQIDELKNKKEQFKKFTLELNSCLTEDSSLASQISNNRIKLMAKKEEVAKLNARNLGFRESLAGGLAIQRILELKDSGKIKGIYGQVSDLGKVGSEFSLALEVAAGPRIRSIVVEDDKVAADCIKYLKENKLGTATFLPLNKLRTVVINPSLKEMKNTNKDVKGMALELITYDEKFSNVFSYVFENTLVVEDIESARKLGIGKYRMVTLSGDLCETSGAMSGGFRHKTPGAGFQEKELNENIEKLEQEIAELNDLMTILEDRKNENEDRIERLRNLKANLEAEIITLEKTLHLDSADLDLSKKQKQNIDREIKDIDKKLDSLMEDISGKNRDIANLKIKKQHLREEMSKLRDPALLAELTAFEDKRRELTEEIINVKGEIKNSESEIANVLNPEKENISKILKQQDKEKDSFESEKKKISEKIKDFESSLKEKEAAEKKFMAQFKELFAKRQKFSDEVSKLENIILNKEDEMRRIEQKINLVSLQNAEVKANYAAMVEEYKQYEGVELFKNKPEEDILREISQFERLMSEIGAVNMRALDIYEKVEKEYKILNEKKERLMKEREDVLLMISEIDLKKKDLFMKSYEAVDRNFKTIFSALSVKGEASLELEDANDPFNAGVTIKVRITGSKFLDIRSLSGGEKTLTALAFIFAIQEHEPASFYIFDEVDAALDKRNSEKLAQLIRNYSNKAQYIIVSHNDAVISEADNLYGVSMNEFGISKVTSLKI